MQVKPPANSLASLIENFHSSPGVPIIVQSGRVLKVGEILHLAPEFGRSLQPFAVIRIATREEWTAAMRDLGYRDKPEAQAICFAEVVTD